MASSLITRNQKLNVANLFLQSIANTPYYLFVGDHLSTNAKSNVYDRDYDITNMVYSNMLMGKKIDDSDAKLCIKNIPYESNTLYTMYDDQNANLSSNTFYAIVNAGSYYHIFKCLDNNGGQNSTVTPDFAHITGSNTEIYQTSDGYRWKYSYSVSSAIEAKFASTDYFPIVVNTEVQTAAVQGAIDIIKIEDGGEKYDNYVLGSFTTDDIRINGNTKLYAISNTTASSVNGYYTGCLLYISSGDGIGEHRTIVDYISNANGNFIVLDEDLSTPTNGSEYQIYPEVTFVSDGNETETAVARALVNSVASNSIYRIEMLDRGKDYQKATATVEANDVVGVTETASLRVIYSPKGGHGSDIASEFFANTVSVYSKFSNTESNTILTGNIFQQIGLIKQPLFANVELNFSNIFGSFLNGEKFYKVNPILLTNNAEINATSTTLTASSANLTNIASGTMLYLKASNGTSQQIIAVNSYVNSTSLTMAANGDFACTEVSVYLANVSAEGYILDVNTSTQVFTTNVSNSIENSDIVIGVSSSAEGIVNTVSRSSVEKTFSTYIQASKYIGANVSGTFATNEIVFQTSLATKNAAFYTSTLDGSNLSIYVTNSHGVFNVGGGNTIVGNTSGAVATIDEKFGPELVYGSGEIMYIENVDPVERQSDQAEAFNIYLQF